MEEEPDDDDRATDSRSAVRDDIPEFSREALEHERIYDSLAHVRRRYLCYLLCDRAEIQVDEAAAAIADWESDGDSVPESHHDRVRLSLLHSHIPKLRASDVVDFDPHSETLVRGDDAEAVLAALQAVGRTLRPGDDDGNEGG
ncbi:DUF7344 domain-containing protein [Haloarcula onubensis]|uniref:DUF7344 domain-containing protein n=1 Tax=Haloarcula onubensis TaxID=2950539 RepID=A0ABU2FJZ2_9EURY|nr:hypothetical protein [Halomicroarcula sp. S3CR25-11]MDS0281086.1 hypothetical protein [Halomicroarcula sp. S3CR25-11]